jgi:AcrR family transcriptional regulator
MLAMPPERARAAVRRRRYHHGDLRRALLEEAVRTIDAEGVDALTLRTVGRRLGVSRTALYRHFADKNALLATVAREGFRTFRLALIDAWVGAGQGLAGFEAMGAAYVRFAVAHPSHYRVMFGRFLEKATADPELGQEASGAFQALVDALVQLQERKLARPDDPRQLALFVWAVVHGVAMLAIDGQLRGPERDIDGLTRFAIDRLNTGIAATRSV